MTPDAELNTPLAVVFGCDAVSVAQAYSGKWLVVVWHAGTGPELTDVFQDYAEALARAKRQVACMSRAILDLPRAFSRMHVLSNDAGYEVLHEGRSGENFASLGTFGHDDYDEAIDFAKSQLGQYAPCLFGEVCSCHF